MILAQLTIPGLDLSAFDRVESQRMRDRRVALAAYAFLASRARLVGATGIELLTAAIELDDDLHSLTLAAGLDCPGCECSECAALRAPADELD